MKRLGWVYEIVSEGFIFTEIKLECIPSLLGKPSKNIEEEFIQDLQRVYDGDENKNSYSKSQRDSLATIACHNALRVGDQLSRSEMRDVVDILQESDKGAYNCPHGRPTISGLGKASHYFVKRKEREYSLL